MTCFSYRDDGSSAEARLLRIQNNEVYDNKYGFERYKEPVDRLGWLINMHPVSRAFHNHILVMSEINVILKDL